MADDVPMSGPLEAERPQTFVVSLRYRDEVEAALEAAGRGVSAARRVQDAVRKFEQSPALVALVDMRGAFDGGLDALRLLAPVADKRRAALVALMSRQDAERLGEAFMAGATHFHFGGRRGGELADALRFADRYVRRLRAGDAAAAVAAVERRLSSGAYWTWRKGQQRIAVSPAFAAMLGEAPDTGYMPIEGLIDHVTEDDREMFLRGVLRVMRGGQSGELDHRMVVDGQLRTITHYVRPTRGPDGRLTGLTATVHDLDALMLEQRVAAHFDVLTGLANASFARDWIEQLLGGRSSFEPACIVLLLSLSRFDTINAAYGRQVADALLQAVARRIRRTVGADLPDSMLVARLSGAEFAIAYAGPVKLADVVLMAERLGETFEQPFLVAGRVIHLATRIGIAIGESDLDGADTLLRRASAALAQAKAGEPNSFEVFMGKGPEDLVTRMASLGDDLRVALGEDSFELLYQPQVDIVANSIVGVEALTRWRHPKLGLLSPETLMGVAESTEVVQLVGRHLLSKALAEAANWPQRLRHLRLAINVTAFDLALPNFSEMVLIALAENSFPPARLTVELTESSMVRDVDHSMRVLSELRDHGVSIAIDDFGTGYSSLAYLRSLPLDYLKVDKRMVSDLFGSQRDRVVVKGVVRMARNLDLTVIAEGVETEEQLVAVSASGCQLYQGYLCSKPVGSGRLAQLVKRWPERLPD